MSSAAYETAISTDRRARLLLAGALAVAAFTGVGLLLAMPFRLPVAAGLALPWIGGCLLDAVRLRRGAARIDRIVISAGGDVRGVRGDTPAHTLELLPGSVVGERWGWLRLRFEDGLRYGELVRRDAAGPEAWRRLRVIWRHRGSFGASGIS